MTSPSVDLTITDVKMPKEILLSNVTPGSELYANMMRNRVVIHANASFSVEIKNHIELEEVMWKDFAGDIRKYCDTNNIGLYFISAQVIPTFDDRSISAYQDSFLTPANGSKGQLTVGFEDMDDYARFLKAKAVMFKLSSY